MTDLQTSLMLSEREWICLGGFLFIIFVGITGFILRHRLNMRTVLAFLMITVFISMVSAVTLISTAYGLSRWAGTIVLFGLFGFYKLMNQFEINLPPPHTKTTR